MKTKQEYTQEMTDLMVDLQEAIAKKDDDKVNEILVVVEAIMHDIKEANYE